MYVFLPLAVNKCESTVFYLKLLTNVRVQFSL